MPVILIVIGYAGLVIASGEPTPFTIVTGISMQPTLLAGSIAVLWHVPFNQLHAGEIIVFTPPESVGVKCQSSAGPSLTSESTGFPCFVIHRIVNISYSNGQEVITTKGDNNDQSFEGIDFPVYQSQYIGVVVMQLPVAGYITQPPYNEYAGIILLALFIYELFSGRDSKK